MGAVLQPSRQREAIWDEHEAIAEAIAAGDADARRRPHRPPRPQASENLLARLADVLEPPIHERPRMKLTPDSTRSSTATATCSSPACSRPRRRGR